RRLLQRLDVRERALDPIELPGEIERLLRGPHTAHDLQIFVGAPVAGVMVEPVAVARLLAVAAAGDDVQGQAAAGEVIERRRLPRGQRGRDEAGPMREEIGEALGDGGRVSRDQEAIGRRGGVADQDTIEAGAFVRLREVARPLAVDGAADDVHGRAVGALGPNADHSDELDGHARCYPAPGAPSSIAWRCNTCATLPPGGAMAESIVTYVVDGRIGIVTLNRPDKLNAISAELRRALVERLHEADRDPATSVVVLRAAGRSFCAGYDISPNPARAARKGNALAWHESLTDDVALEIAPWDMRKPVIASVRGHCLGGGCELVMMCDITIAADDALFGEPEIRFSNVGPALIMPFVIGFKRARELLYLGDPIDAQTALQYGMVNRVVPRAELPAATLRYARRMALI